MRNVLSSIAQTVGAALISGGLWSQWPWLGLVAAGSGLFYVGWVNS